MSETEAKYETDSLTLQYGKELRKNSDLIYCHAIVHFKDGTNWMPLGIYIHPENINEAGYIEEIWIIVDTKKVVLNGKTYTIHSHDYASFIYTNKAWIHHLADSKNHIPLPPLSDNLRVKYIVEPDTLEA